MYLLNKKHTSNKIKRHTNKHPGKPIYFPCSKKPDQAKSKAHQMCFDACALKDSRRGLRSGFH